MEPIDLESRSAPKPQDGTTEAMLLEDRYTLNVEWWAKPFGGAWAWYKGAFTFRRPSIGDQTEISIRCANLSGGVSWDAIPLADRTVLVATAICLQLLEAKPDWFRLDGRDQGVVQPALLLELLGAYQTWMDSCFRPPAGAGESPEGFRRVVIRPAVGAGARPPAP